MTIVVIGENTGNDFSGTEDAQLQENAATTNDGGGTDLFASTFGVGDRRWFVIRFTGLSNITGPVTVNSATLRMKQRQNNGVGTESFTLRRCLRDWVEAQVTWNIYKTSNNWTSGGGMSNGNDRSSTISVTKAAGTSDVVISFTSAQLASDVQGFINGTFANDGWHMGLDDETGGDSRFWLFDSSEHGTDGNRPELEVDYTVGSARPRLSGGRLVNGGILLKGLV